MLAEDVYKAGFGAVVAGAFLVDLFHLDVVGVACQDGVQECPLDGSQVHWSTYFGHKISKIRCQKNK